MTRPPLFGSLVIVAVIGALVGGFWSTFSSLIGLYDGSDASAHTLFVLCAFLFLLWNTGPELARLPIRAFPLGIIGLLAAGFIWLAGELVFARVLTYFGILVMIPMAVLTILGYRWLAALGFPLAFVLFAVPIGGSIVPTLVDWTAATAVAGLNMAGVPVYREGAFLVVPSGTWSIADACSGIAYLRTVTMLVTLYAWSMYRSPSKRLVFIAGGFVIGIAGNWLRAFLTILIAHISDNRFLRDDHYTFGWVLFALMLVAYSAIGYRYRDRDSDNTLASGTKILDQTTGSPGVPQAGAKGVPHDLLQEAKLNKSPLSTFKLISISVAVFAAVAIWPIALQKLQAPGLIAVVEVPDMAPAGGWTSISLPAFPWTPTLTNASRERVQSFEKAGHRVDVFIGVFQDQNWTSKLVTITNGFAPQDNPRWTLAVRGSADTNFSKQALKVDAGLILGNGMRILAWRWYWVHGLATASDPRAKMAQLSTRLARKSDTSAWVSVYTDASASPAEAAATLDEFMHDMESSMQASLQNLSTTTSR